MSSDSLGGQVSIDHLPLEAGLHRAHRELMGTVATITVREVEADGAQVAIRAAFERLHQIDRRFSPYLEASEISRIGRGELTVPDAHPEVTTVDRKSTRLNSVTSLSRMPSSA